METVPSSLAPAEQAEMQKHSPQSFSDLPLPDCRFHSIAFTVAPDHVPTTGRTILQSSFNSIKAFDEGGCAWTGFYNTTQGWMKSHQNTMYSKIQFSAQDRLDESRDKSGSASCWSWTGNRHQWRAWNVNDSWLGNAEWMLSWIIYGALTCACMAGFTLPWFHKLGIMSALSPSNTPWALYS